MYRENRIRAGLFACCAALLVQPAALLAESPAKQPPVTWCEVAVLRWAAWNRWCDHLTTIGQPLANTLPEYLSRKTLIKSIDGLDPSRTGGIVLRTDGITLAPMLLIPVRDAAAVLAVAQPWIGQAELVLPGLWKLGRGEWTGYALERQGWLYVAQTEELLRDGARPDPATIFDAMPNEWDLGIALHWQNLPEVYRTWAIDKLRERTQAEARALAATPAASAATKAWLYAGLERLLHDTEDWTLGWSFNAQAQVAVEAKLRPRAGSPLAKLNSAYLSEARAQPPGFAHTVGDNPASDQRCFRLELDLRSSNDSAAAFRETFFAGTNTGWHAQLTPTDHENSAGPEGASDLPIGERCVRQAIHGLCRGQLHVAMSVEGSRPPAVVTVSTAGGKPEDWFALLGELLAATSGAPNEQESPQEASPKPSRVAFPAATSERQAAAELAIPPNGWLRNLAGPDAQALAVQHDEALHAVVGVLARNRLEQMLRPAPEGLRRPSRSNTVEEKRLLMVEIRSAALMRLASIAAESWETKALLGKLSYVVAADRDRLRCEFHVGKGGYSWRMEADRGLSQAAALGLALLLIE